LRILRFCHALGNDLIRTPHLDRLVREGVSFTRAAAARN